MDDKLQQRRLTRLRDFARAWNEHDLQALMDCMSDDCEFRSAAGAGIAGSEYTGREQVEVGYATIFEVFPDACWNDDRHFVSGDRGVSEWRFTATAADGQAVEMYGCDLFVFDGDRIRLKDSYRKQRT
jgi:ketosteroid isomerase-like protein